MNAAPADPALESLFAADASIVKVGRKIRVLDAIGWTAQMETDFLAGFRAGKPVLPVPPTKPQALDGEIQRRHAFGVRDRVQVVEHDGQRLTIFRDRV